MRFDDCAQSQFTEQILLFSWRFGYLRKPRPEGFAHKSHLGYYIEIVKAKERENERWAGRNTLLSQNTKPTLYADGGYH